MMNNRIVVSSARRHFKMRIGQVNHFLITLLVGLDGVKKGSCVLPEEFRTSWNPRDVIRSADRSTRFALDATLSWAIDNLDSYFVEAARKPSIIEDASLKSDYEGAERSVNKRFNAFYKAVKRRDGEITKYAALVALAIQWRNNLVHFGAENELGAEYDSFLRSNSDFYYQEFCHLDVDQMLGSFLKKDGHPSFKEVTSMIRAIHKFVEKVDCCLLQSLNEQRFMSDLLDRHYSEYKKTKIKINTFTKDRRDSFYLTILRQYGFGVKDDLDVI